MNIKFEIQNPRILQVSKDLIDGRFFIRDCQKHNGYIKEFSNDLSGVFFSILYDIDIIKRDIIDVSYNDRKEDLIKLRDSGLEIIKKARFIKNYKSEVLEFNSLDLKKSTISDFELLYIRLEYILQELDRQKGSIECLLNLSLREFYQAMNELGYNRAQQVDAIMQIFKACDYEKNNEQYIKRQRDKLLQVYDSEVYENMKDLEIII